MDFSTTEMQERLSRVRQLMADAGIDALYLKDEQNVRYVSGFKGEPRTLVLTQSDSALYTSFRTEPWAKAQTVGIEISTEPKVLDDITKRLSNSTVKTIGIEHMCTHSSFLELQQQLKGFDLKLSTVVETARMIKSETEIGYMRKAQEMAEQVLSDTLDDIRPGVTERVICGRIRSRISEIEAADNYAFGPLIVAGENAWEIHHKPDFRELRNGDFLIIDMGVLYKGYNSDMTRTLCIGSATKEMRHVYDTVKTAQKLAFAAIHAGQLNHVVDAAARDHIEAAGYGKFFTHGLGHSIGLAVHDPLLGFGKTQSANTLQPNMVMTVEPGIYLQDKFGVRIEDTVVVTETGYENLMTFDRNLIELG